MRGSVAHWRLGPRARTATRRRGLCGGPPQIGSAARRRQPSPAHLRRAGRAAAGLYAGARRGEEFTGLTGNSAQNLSSWTSRQRRGHAAQRSQVLRSDGAVQSSDGSGRPEPSESQRKASGAGYADRSGRATALTPVVRVKRAGGRGAATGWSCYDSERVAGLAVSGLLVAGARVCSAGTAPVLQPRTDRQKETESSFVCGRYLAMLV